MALKLFKPADGSRVVLGKLKALSDCQLLRIPKDKIDQLIQDVPQFSYLIRKYRLDTDAPEINWLRGYVEIH